MIIINDNYSSNPYDKSIDNNVIKERITKLVTLLLTCAVKRIIIIKIIKMLIITIMKIIVNNNN